jgi:hypothetical protein
MEGTEPSIQYTGSKHQCSTSSLCIVSHDTSTRMSVLLPDPCCILLILSIERIQFSSRYSVSLRCIWCNILVIHFVSLHGFCDRNMETIYLSYYTCATSPVFLTAIFGQNLSVAEISRGFSEPESAFGWNRNTETRSQFALHSFYTCARTTASASVTGISHRPSWHRIRPSPNGRQKWGFELTRIVFRRRLVEGSIPLQNESSNFDVHCSFAGPFIVDLFVTSEMHNWLRRRTLSPYWCETSLLSADHLRQ